MKNSTFWATFTTISLVLAGGLLQESKASNNFQEIAQQPNCKSPQTTLDMNMCSSQEFKAADTKLNQLYQQLRAKLNSKQQQRLTVAQRSWIKFRDETCSYEAGHFEGGTLAPPVYISCRARVTKQRVKDLEDYWKQANL
jgi:uncharacterized protein YecT (DUF1311 family)